MIEFDSTVRIERRPEQVLAILADLLAKVPVPTLVLCGADEEEGAAEFAREAAARAPRATAETLEGLGHLQVFWRSDLTAPRIARFLDQHAAG